MAKANDQLEHRNISYKLYLDITVIQSIDPWWLYYAALTAGKKSHAEISLHWRQLSTVRAPVFDRYQFFGTSEHYGKTHGSLLSGWMNYNYTACCWFPTSSNILILPPQFWQIRFESCWLRCSKCRILVLLRYL